MTMTHPAGRTAVRISRFAAVAVLVCVTAIAASGAHATTVTNGSGILNTFIGDPNSPDLNALSATATYDSNNIYLSATMAGAIGLTALNSAAHGGTDQGIYVWGVDRGSGTPVLDGPTTLPTDTTPPLAPHVTFDAFIVLQDLANGHGDGFMVLLDETGAFKSAQNLAADAISYSGDTINLFVPLSSLPTQGVGVADFGYNIWPRLNGISSNKLIASFLPADAVFQASAVPEPAAWTLMIGGFGLAGGMIRARRRVLMA